MKTIFRPYKNNDKQAVQTILHELDFNLEAKLAAFWVVEIEQKIIGVMQVDEYTDFIFISNTGISNTFRKLGIASKFIEYIISHYKKPVYLHTIIPEFYLKNHFKIISKFDAVTKNPKECAECEPEKCVCMMRLPV